ncbi:MAG: response regulator [Lachnospiraceae bacterium]|nr:response regulator [Lachnospiraceae bacterium]
MESMDMKQQSETELMEDRGQTAEAGRDNAKVVIISVAESFLAKSLMTKLAGVNIRTEYARADMKDIEAHADGMQLVILFLSDDIDTVPEALVYLKDTVCDKDLGLILIGEESQYELVKKTIPQQAVTEWFQRPLDIEQLIKKVSTYMDENTGEKRKKSILIVDDDITYMRTVYEWLKGSYHVGMAANGVQAISYLAKNKADLVLLDYEMPVANGPQVLSMLKNDSETEQIPVMFLTGHGDRESVLSVVGLSPVDYLLKTIDKPALLKKLSDFFEKNRK